MLALTRRASSSTLPDARQCVKSQYACPKNTLSYSLDRWTWFILWTGCKSINRRDKRGDSTKRLLLPQDSSDHSLRPFPTGPDCLQSDLDVFVSTTNRVLCAGLAIMRLGRDMIVLWLPVSNLVKHLGPGRDRRTTLIFVLDDANMMDGNVPRGADLSIDDNFGRAHENRLG